MRGRCYLAFLAMTTAMATDDWPKCPYNDQGQCDFAPYNPVKCGKNYACNYDTLCSAWLANFRKEECCQAPQDDKCGRKYEPVICGSQKCPYENPCLASLAGYNIKSQCTLVGEEGCESCSCFGNRRTDYMKNTCSDGSGGIDTWSDPATCRKLTCDNWDYVTEGSFCHDENKKYNGGNKYCQQTCCSKKKFLYDGAECCSKPNRPTQKPTRPPGCPSYAKKCPDEDGSGGTYWIFTSPEDKCKFDDCKCNTDSKKCRDGTRVWRDASNGCKFEECPAYCPPDTQKCWDGTVVGRNAKDCSFLPCPDRPDRPDDRLPGFNDIVQIKAWTKDDVGLCMNVNKDNYEDGEKLEFQDCRDDDPSQQFYVRRKFKWDNKKYYIQPIKAENLYVTGVDVDAQSSSTQGRLKLKRIQSDDQLFFISSDDPWDDVFQFGLGDVCSRYDDDCLFVSNNGERAEDDGNVVLRTWDRIKFNAETGQPGKIVFGTWQFRVIRRGADGGGDWDWNEGDQDDDKGEWDWDDKGEWDWDDNDNGGNFGNSPFDCGERKTTGNCRCCKDECERLYSSLSRIKDCKTDVCRDFYGRDTCQD